MNRISATLLLCSALPIASASAQTIVFRSGNGQHGQPDSKVTLLAGSSSSELRPQAFVAQDFSDALNGPNATVVSSYPGWISGISDASASWVAVNSSRTPKSALYAIKFNVGNTCWQSASLQFSFAVDDQLGDPSGGANQLGLYLNQTALAGTSGGGIGSETTWSFDVSGILQPGENTIHVYDRDNGAIVSGVIFSGRVQITPMPPAFLTNALTSNRFNGMPNNTLQVTASYDGIPGSQQLDLEFRHALTGQTIWVTMPPILDRSIVINTFEFDLCDWVPSCRCRISGVVPNGSVDGIAFGMYWKDKDGYYDLRHSRSDGLASISPFEGAWPITYTDATWAFLTPQLAGCVNDTCRQQARIMLYGSELLLDGVYTLCCQNFNSLPKK